MEIGDWRLVTTKRDSETVAWRKIARDLEETIAGGELVPGARLPTEMELARRYKVNRHTVRRAIAALTNEGRIEAVQGRGTFVAEKPISYPLTARTRFSEIVSAQDLVPGGRMIATAIEPGAGLVAERLELDEGTPVLRIDTLRVVEGHPVVVGTGWLSQALVPDFLIDYAELGSVSAALERAGFGDYRRQTSWVTAEPANDVDAAHLRIAEGAPLLVVESLNVTAAGAPLQFSRSRFVADAIQLRVDS